MPAVADNVTLPVPQFESPIPIGREGNGLIVAITVSRDAEAHPEVVFRVCT